MDKKKKRIYLSLPISGYDLDERRSVARSMQERLESMGYDVVNPMSNGLSADAGTRAHMRRDIELLLGCDAILFMERFTHSAGCMTEFHVATAIGLEVMFEECLDSGELVFFK